MSLMQVADHVGNGLVMVIQLTSLKRAVTETFGKGLHKRHELLEVGGGAPILPKESRHQSIGERVFREDFLLEGGFLNHKRGGPGQGAMTNL